MRNRVAAHRFVSDKYVVAYAPELNSSQRVDITWLAGQQRHFDQVEVSLLKDHHSLQRRKLLLLYAGRECIRVRVVLPSTRREAESGIPWLVEKFLVNTVADNVMSWVVHSGQRAMFDVLVCSTASAEHLLQELTTMGLGDAYVAPIHALLPLPETPDPVCTRLGEHVYFAEADGSGVVPFESDCASSVESAKVLEWSVDALEANDIPVLNDRRSSPPVFPNRWLLGIAALVWVGISGTLFGLGWYYQTEAVSLQREAFSKASATFSGLRPELDLQRQVRQRYAGSMQSEATAFRERKLVLPTLSKIAQVLATESVQVTRYNYYDEAFVLTIQLPQLADIGPLKTRIQNVLGSVDVASAQQEEGFASVQLVLGR